MSFIRNKKQGPIWEDAKLIDSIIEKSNETFRLNAQKEADMERGFTAALQANADRFNHKFTSKIQSDSSVAGVQIFSKNNYPDMMFSNDSIAIEVSRIGSPAEKTKFSTKIGDNYIFRLRYKFVFQIFVLNESVKDVWENIQNNNDKNIKFLLEELKEQEIFTYIIPGFKVKNNQIYKIFG